MKVFVANTQKHFADAFKIRTNVFIGEQNVPAHEEIDELDRYVPILIAYTAEGKPVGTARIILKGDNIAKIGRVAVDRLYRNQGVGKLLMEASLDYLKKNSQVNLVKLDAQLTARPFYGTLGFKAYGDIFLDAGIEHIAMEYVLDNK